MGAAIQRHPRNVSTHSRLKAAGNRKLETAFLVWGFNTQPPEGGWSLLITFAPENFGFNTQPPEGG